MLFLGDWIPIGHNNTDILLTPEIKVVNLECAIVAEHVYATDKAYPIVLGQTAWGVLNAARNIVVNVANNHTYDAGETGFEDLIKLLDNLNIPYYGTITKPYIEVEEKGQKYVIIAGLSKSRSRGRYLAKIENIELLIDRIAGKSDYVIVTPHWGGEGEYTPYPSPAQRRLANRWRAIGVDAIIGHHSHTIQCMERICNKPVFYSIGNFHFPHEESELYPLTRFGLGVVYENGDVTDKLFFRHKGHVTTTVTAENDVELLEDYIDLITKDITLKKWTIWRWARTVGKSYSMKNAASWKLRFRRQPLLTLVKWTIVSMLPRTIILKLGKLFSDNRVELRTRLIENID